MLTLQQLAEMNITEGILNGFDDSLRQHKGYVDSTLFQSWTDRSFNKPSWKEGKDGYVLTGDYRIENIDKYTGPKIKKVNGSFTICKTKLTSLEGIFADGAVVNGTFSLEDNDNLESLVGSPSQVNTLIVNSCKKLKSIEGCPNVIMNMYLSRTGKKFDKEKLQTQVSVGKNIFCSNDSNEEIIAESMICESFKSPHLSRLWDRVKELKVDISKEEWNKDGFYKNEYSMKDLLGTYWQLDKIESSAVHEYTGIEGVKMARKVMTGKIQGWIILYDHNGKITHFIYGNNVVFLGDQYKIVSQASRGKYKIGDIIDRYVAKADVVVIVDLVDAPTAFDIHNKRVKDREGAIAYYRERDRELNDITPKNIRYYQDIADENRKRYKAMILKLRAQKASTTGNYDKIKTRINGCLTRQMNLIGNVIKTPAKYRAFDVEQVNKLCEKLVKLLCDYADIFTTAEKGNTYNSTYLYTHQTVERAVAAIENDINDIAFKAETKLNELERL